MNIDKRLDSLVDWILHEPAYTKAEMKDKIKQLFQELIDEVIGAELVKIVRTDNKNLAETYMSGFNDCIEKQRQKAKELLENM